MSERFLRYSEYRDSRCELGMLPSGWEEVKFRFLFSSIKGKIPDQVLPHQEEGAIPYVSMEYLRDGEVGGFVVPNSKVSRIVTGTCFCFPSSKVTQIVLYFIKIIVTANKLNNAEITIIINNTKNMTTIAKNALRKVGKNKSKNQKHRS